MEASSWAPPHLCRLIFPAGVFLLFLLYLTSQWRLPRSVCTWRVQHCPSGGEIPADHETRPPPAWTPSATLQPTPPDTPEQGFRIQRLRSTFAASLTPGGEILLGEYLQGWTELRKLLSALGAAFRLVSSEAAGKVGELQKLRGGPHGHHYQTLGGMVAFEEGSGPEEAGPGTGPGTGSGARRWGLRTLLRLHRALRWLQLFLRGLAEDGEAAPARLCAEAYREALAPFHAWWVRRAVGLAFLAMPGRAELLRMACGGAGPDAQRVLRATVRTLESVYNATQDVYAAHGLLGLP